MRALERVRSDLLRLKWHVAAMRFQLAMRKHAIALKAGFDPDQPRMPSGNPDGGQWTRGGEGDDSPNDEFGSSDATEFSAAERLPQGRRGILEAALRLIEAFKKENGFEDLFGYSRNRTVAATNMDGEWIYGSSGRSPTFTSADRRDAINMRTTLFEKYPDVMKYEDSGWYPNDALFHAEANVMMRAARKYGGSLAGKEFDIFVDRPVCGGCRRVLPLLGRELGNPMVRFIDDRGKVLTLRGGSWVN